jgi:hypothetical protein
MINNEVDAAIASHHHRPGPVGHRRAVSDAQTLPDKALAPQLGPTSTPQDHPGRRLSPPIR